MCDERGGHVTDTARIGTCNSVMLSPERKSQGKYIEFRAATKTVPSLRLEKHSL